MLDFDLSSIDFWPKWKRRVLLLVLLSVGVGWSWFWYIEPLLLEQRALDSAEQALLQSATVKNLTDVTASPKTLTKIHPKDRGALKKAVISLLESHAVVLEKWAPNAQDWTLQVRGNYSSIFKVIRDLAQGAIVWNLQSLVLRRVSPTDVRLSIVANPLAWSDEEGEIQTRKAKTQGLQGKSDKSLFSELTVSEPMVEAERVSAPAMALPAIVLSGVVRLEGQEPKAIFFAQGTSHIAQKGDIIMDWHITAIEAERVQLKNTRQQVLIVELFKDTGTNEK